MTDSPQAMLCRPVTPHAVAPGEGSPLRSDGIDRQGGGTGRLVEPASIRFVANSRRSWKSPVLRMRHPWYEAVKRVVEFLATVVLLAVALPVMLVAVLLVKLTSRGPAFYTQTRVGRYGKPFPI